MDKFKIRPSSIHKIMGRAGLTEKQQLRLNELHSRATGDGRPLTPKQIEEYDKLVEKSKELTLPSGCISYLKEWYAYQRYEDRHSENTGSKYTYKGLAMEDEAIAMTGRILGYNNLSKNEELYENEWIVGTPDVICTNEILDTKCSWNSKTFLETVTSDKLDYRYEWQMRGYMMLCDKPKARVCYCLVDTPEEFNRGEEVSYLFTPEADRFVAKEVTRDEITEQDIVRRVDQCRSWLVEYDKMINERLRK